MSTDNETLPPLSAAQRARLAVECSCERPEKCGAFVCDACGEYMPWCYGDDGGDELCDACWSDRAGDDE